MKKYFENVKSTQFTATAKELEECRKRDATRCIKKDAEELGMVVLSRAEHDYLKAGTRAATKAGVFKAQIFNDDGKLIAVQG